MATLNEVMTQTADAIREKTGKSELLAPINFAEEIKSISAGGGSSTIEYLDVSELSIASKNQLLLLSLLSRNIQFEALGQIQEPSIGLTSSFIMIALADPSAFSACANAVNALGIDFNMQIKSISGSKTILEEIKYMPVYDELDSIPRITKEQFYDLNA